jgi:hypothetical protein
MLYGCLEELHHLERDAVLSVMQELEQEVSFDPPPGEALVDKASEAEAPPLASVSPLRPNGEGVTASAPAQATATQADSAPMPHADELIYRIQELEKELDGLKQTMRNEQKLLRKAILLQMDLDEFEDFK